jgi:hypothetical protein
LPQRTKKERLLKAGYIAGIRLHYHFATFRALIVGDIGQKNLQTINKTIAIYKEETAYEANQQFCKEDGKPIKERRFYDSILPCPKYEQCVS